MGRPASATEIPSLSTSSTAACRCSTTFSSARATTLPARQRRTRSTARQPAEWNTPAGANVAHVPKPRPESVTQLPEPPGKHLPGPHKSGRLRADRSYRPSNSGIRFSTYAVIASLASRVARVVRKRSHSLSRYVDRVELSVSLRFSLMAAIVSGAREAI